MSALFLIRGYTCGRTTFFGSSDVSNIKKRGFGSMDPERVRELARKGGAAVPKEKRSFSQDRQLAARAGKKGGEKSHRNYVLKHLPRPQADFDYRELF